MFTITTPLWAACLNNGSSQGLCGALPLPKVLIDIPESNTVLGNSFESSISSGIISGIMFEIEGYVSRFPDNIIVVTGGDANFFAKRIKNSIFVICNLVLIGLALIADEYVKKVD